MQYKINAKPQDIKRVANNNRTGVLFQDFDEEEGKLTAEDVFQPKKNVKRLVLKPKNSPDQRPNPIVPDSTTPENQGDDSVVFAKTRDPSSPPQVESTVMEFKNRSGGRGRGFNFSLENTFADDESSLLSIHETNTAPVLRCGLIQSRLDYYTIPKLEDIDNYFDEEKGTCIVDSFTIGRKGFGSIFWNCPVDLKGLNLDEIVHIRRKEVIVYPDDEEKPEVGQGLNLPAQITLDQVWPVDKTTHEIVRDVEKLEALNYTARLEALTVKQNAIFKDYRPETGSWVFNVKHFSKYGFADDDDEDEAVVSSSIPPKTSTSIKSIRPSVLQESASSSQTVIRPISQFTTAFEQIYNELPKPEDYVFKGPTRGVTSQKQTAPKAVDQFEELRNVLFEDDCSIIMHDNQSGISCQQTFLHEDKPHKRLRHQFLSTSPVVGEVIEFSPKSGQRYHLNEAGHLFTGSVKSSLLQSQSHQYYQHKMTNQLPQVNIKRRQLKCLVNEVPLKNKCLTDIASFKMTPGQKVHFFASGSGQLLTVTGKQITLYSGLEQETLGEKTTQERIQAQFKNNSVVVTSCTSSLPFIEIRKNIVNALNPREVNLLILALYGNIMKRNGMSLNAYEDEEARRNCLIDWLCNRNRSYKLPSQVIPRIFYFLAMNDVKSAVDEAVASHQPRLALMLSCGLCTFSRDEALSQLDSWKMSGADAWIETGILRLFILISGAINWTISSGEVITAMNGLKWSQELALNLIYNQETGLHDCIACMESYGDCDDSIEFHLIKNMFGDQWQTLCQCQSLLEAWFLHQSLVAFNAIPCVSSMSDSLHGQLVSQVIHKSVKWSAFIALHIRDDVVRGKTVSEVLAVNAEKIGESEEDFLTKQLLIPEKEVASCKAVFFKTTFNYIEEAKALLSAGKWSRGHDILMKNVFPDLVIQEKTDVLVDLLKQLHAHQDNISSWFTTGAHIYDVYTACLTNTPVSQVISMIERNGINMHSMKCPTHKHTFARTEMIQKILSFIQKASSTEAKTDSVSEEQQGSSGNSQAVEGETVGEISVSQVVSVPLPDDFAISHLNDKTKKLLEDLLLEASLPSSIRAK